MTDEAMPSRAVHGAPTEPGPSRARPRARVGVNLLWIVPGEVGGSEEHTVRLLAALAEAAPDDLDVRLYVNRSFPAAHPDLVAALPTVVAPVSGRSRPLRVAAETTWLAARSRRDRLAVVHHAGGTMPPLRPVPGIVTLHDLQPLSHPERFGLVKRTYIRLVAPRSLRAAALVVTLTGFTGTDAVERAGVDPARLRRVPSGIDEPGPEPDPLIVEETLARYGLAGRRVVLYPAITYDHKNHRTLVAAMARLAPSHPDLTLVLTGGAGPVEAEVMAEVASRGLADRVRRTGRIPETDLDVLYRRAAALAFPSSYEGFGLPVLEAMSRGCPVVASTAGALPEVTGGAADLVDPLDVEGWADALGEVLDRPEHRLLLVRRGWERARHYRWPEAAARLAAVYREAAHLPPDRPPQETR